MRRKRSPRRTAAGECLRGLSSRRRCSLPERSVYARVEQGVREVDRQIDHHHRQRRVERDGHDHGVIVHREGRQDPLAKSGKPHHLLEDDRAAEEESELDPHQGQDGQERVA